MAERPGSFWDAMQGRAPMPRAAATLGLEFIEVSHLLLALACCGLDYWILAWTDFPAGILAEGWHGVAGTMSPAVSHADGRSALR